MPYDLFISYSRKDNATGHITELKTRIEDDYRAFTKDDLRCFFDVEDIQGMDDWRHRILSGLRESNLLILFLSPGYLASPYCEWEIVEYLKYEHSRAAAGQGVAPVYFVEVPGLDAPGFEEQAAVWVSRVRRRNHFDLRPWYDEGARALQREDVRTRLDDLNRSLRERLTRLRRIAEAPGNLPAHNPRFVGRADEMRRLHESAGLGVFGMLTAVQGVGGFGKTALALQYASAYADFYPGGRWLVGCAGEHNLSSAIRRLDVDLRITFTEEEKKDSERAARRILSELEARARSGAEARSGEKDPPSPRALIILDNVESADLLQPPQSDLFTGKAWLHVLATTRLSPDELGHDPERQTLVAVDELPEEDALRLIESYQHQGRFPNTAEQAAAREIVKLLGGFTLAVEVVAVHLGEKMGRITCTAFLERLRKEGLEGLEEAAKATKRGIAHAQKLVSATLAPTLALLTPSETLVLSLASLLPPDTIPLPWLRTLAARKHPELKQDAEPGYDDPWLSLVNHLIGLRLLQVVDIDPDAGTPRLVRMHRLVGEFARESSTETQELADTIRTFALERANYLSTNWFRKGCRWEVYIFFALTWNMIEQRDWEMAARIAMAINNAWAWLDKESISAPLYRHLQKTIKDENTIDVTLMANFYRCLSAVCRESCPDEALGHAERALMMLRDNGIVDGTPVAEALSSCAQAKMILGKYDEVRELLEEALEIAQSDDDGENLLVAELANRLGNANIFSDNREAHYQLTRAVRIAKNLLPEGHPAIAVYMANLARIESALENYERARELIHEALEIDQASLDPDHIHINIHRCTLAEIENTVGNLDTARDLVLHVIESEAKRKDNPVFRSMTYLQLSDVERKAENFEASKDSLMQVLSLRQGIMEEINPQNIDVYVRIGHAYAEMHEYDDALLWLSKARTATLANIDDDSETSDKVSYLNYVDELIKSCEDLLSG
jgi:tetratricopeptide (TPR) repeat protein